MSGFPTSPLDESNKSHHMRKSSKQTKALSRSSKRSSPSHEHGSVVMDGRHKRVWKACERCRMKKTKCDGESPCKRCKDDGLVCTAGSRKKTEFKQLPRGYAEVLENTQYALIATVQKLYTMVRNNESWDLGEPEMNDRGQPVIHDIASKLGCIRQSPDLPCAFPEGEDDFAELQVQLQASSSEAGRESMLSRTHSEDSTYSSPALERTERGSSSESDHSNISNDYNQMLWAQQQRQMAAFQSNRPASNTESRKPTQLSINQQSSMVEDEPAYSAGPSLNTSTIPSPIYTDLSVDSPIALNSPYSSWQDDFLGQSSSLDLQNMYMRPQQFPPLPGAPQLKEAMPQQGEMDYDSLSARQLADGLNFADGTIRPNMLHCSPYLVDQMDNIMFTGEYDIPMGMA